MLKFYNAWVLLTLSIFYFGPIDWSTRGTGMVAAVVLSCLLFFNLGAGLGKRLPVLPAYEFPILKKTFVQYAVVFGFIILSTIHIKSLTGQSILNPFNYSLDFGGVYTNFQKNLLDRNVSAGSMEGLLLMLQAMLFPAVIFLFVLNFRKSKLIILLLMFPFIASGMMRGTDKEGVDIALYLLILAYYHRILGRNALIVLGLMVLLVFLFLERKMARFGEMSFACLPGSPDACFDYGNFLSTNISPSLEILRIMLVNYITQGYEGLGRALQIPFEFNFGFGQLPAVKGKICQFLGGMCDVQSYGDKLPEYGWDTRYHWQSVYTFLANDFHWVFMPLYFLVLGMFFGVSEKSWCQNHDSLSLTVVMLVTVFFIYSSANMQLTISLGWSVVYLSVFTMQFMRILRNSPSVSRRGG